METPIYRKGKARKGPTFREAILIHAVSRLVLHPYIKNIQASWPKLGHAGILASLNAGVNDLGGTLMNESITRAAGANHGQETSPDDLGSIISSGGRLPRQRTTSYGLANKWSQKNAVYSSNEVKNSIEINRKIQFLVV